jgi:hypothetical protein
LAFKKLPLGQLIEVRHFGVDLYFLSHYVPPVLSTIIQENRKRENGKVKKERVDCCETGEKEQIFGKEMKAGTEKNNVFQVENLRKESI